MDDPTHRSALERVSRRIGWLVVALAFGPAIACADAVLDWNDVGAKAVVTARQSAADGTRTMAMMHVAMFNAVNAIDRRFRPYRFEGRAPANTSPDAAAAAAAHTVLASLFPEQRESIEKAWSASLSELGGRPGVEPGIAIGDEAAGECLAMRKNDGAGAANVYRPITSPGVYVPTVLPASFDWRVVTPWFMREPSQFRPGPPPALASALWARDYNEVKAVGGRDSGTRTASQTEAARFWAATGVVVTNPVTRALVTARPKGLVEEARLFALVNMAASDAYLAVFDAKYAYQFWRPITAIRNGAIDGNDATDPDPAWMPLVETPMHPEYPCAHCISAAAIAAVLEAEFGTGSVGPIVMTSPTASGVTHRWDRLADYVAEVDGARIWGGVHYRNSTEVGERMGRAIGAFAVANSLRAAP